MEFKDTQINISQTVQGDNNGVLSIARDNVSIINNMNEKEKKEIVEIIKSLKESIMPLDIDEDDKLCVLDDLVTIDEQVKVDKPVVIKLKKAYKNIKEFVCKLPATIATGTLILTRADELYTKLKPFIEK